MRMMLGKSYKVILILEKVGKSAHLPLDLQRLKLGSESEDLIWYLEEENLLVEGLLRRG